MRTARTNRLRLMIAGCVLAFSTAGVALAIAQSEIGQSPTEASSGETEPSASTTDEKAELESSTFLPDRDGDPLTIEALNDEGVGYTLDIHGDPDVFEKISPEELAEKLYPCETYDCKPTN